MNAWFVRSVLRSTRGVEGAEWGLDEAAIIGLLADEEVVE